MSIQQRILLVCALVGLLVLVLVSLFADKGLMEYRRLSREHQALLQSNQQIKHQNLNLYRSIDRLKYDPDYVETIARQELGMIGADELIFKFDQRGGKPDGR